MTEIEVREILSDEYPAWDELASASPQGTVFHRSDWTTTAAPLLRRRPLLLGYFEDGALTGGCALHVADGLLPVCSATAPTIPFGGFLLPANGSTRVRENEARQRAVVGALANEVGRRGFMHASIVSAPAFGDIRPLVRDGWTGRVYSTYVLSLADDLFSAISRKARTTVRRGDRNDLRLRVSYDPAVLRDLAVATCARQDRAPPFPKSFLTGLLGLVLEKNLGELWIAGTPSGEPAAGEVVLMDGPTAHRWLAASDGAHPGTGAASLLLFEILRDLQRRGVGAVNLMGGNLPRLSRFVAGFNPALVPYFGVERTRAAYAALLSSKRLLARAVRRGTG